MNISIVAIRLYGTLVPAFPVSIFFQDFHSFNQNIEQAVMFGSLLSQISLSSVMLMPIRGCMMDRDGTK